MYVIRPAGFLKFIIFAVKESFIMKGAPVWLAIPRQRAWSWWQDGSGRVQVAGVNHPLRGIFHFHDDRRAVSFWTRLWAVVLCYAGANIQQDNTDSDSDILRHFEKSKRLHSQCEDTPSAAFSHTKWDTSCSRTAGLETSGVRVWLDLRETRSIFSFDNDDEQEEAVQDAEDHAAAAADSGNNRRRRGIDTRTKTRTDSKNIIRLERKTE